MIPPDDPLPDVPPDDEEPDEPDGPDEEELDLPLEFPSAEASC